MMEREYPEAADQIRELLIHNNYLSQRDVDICLHFNVKTLAGEDDIADIRALHDGLVRDYAGDDAA
jgi:hypothetical protein